MTRILSAAPVASVAFIALLTLAALAVGSGLVPDDAVTLWASAIAAGDGDVALGRIVAAYPTIPFLATVLMEVATPAGTPAPALLCALLFSVMAGAWFLAFRDGGLGLAAAVAATVLIAAHPALLRAAIAGPADMFFVVFLFLFAKGLFDLRAQSAAPEVMKVALALLGLVFSHPVGAAIAIASVPFLALAVRPALVANSAINVVIALVFPAIFCVGAFTYVSWVFPGSGWSFLTAPAASLAAWQAAISQNFSGATGLLALDTGLAVSFALVIGAPAAIAAVVWVRRRGPLVAPALVFVAASVIASVLVVASGVFGEPVAITAAAPVLAAVTLIKIPAVRERMPAFMTLLVVGWIGGVAGLAVVDPRAIVNLTEALDGGADRERVDALNLGHAAAAREGVLVDALNAPAVVLGRGRARGLLTPQGEAFTLAMMFARIDAPYVAVPDPHTPSGSQDRLNKAFPKLYRFGAAGYRLVYQNTTWRLYERIGEAAVSKP